MSSLLLKGHVVVVDDDIVISTFLKTLLGDNGYEVSAFTSATEALVFLRSGNQTDLVISDIKMAQLDGLELLKILTHELPLVPVVLITVDNDLDLAIEAIKSGAYHYIVKPFKVIEMLQIVQRSMEKRNLLKENEALKEEVQNKYHLGNQFIGKSQAMKTIFSLIKKIANSTTNVLITGESGSGKEMVAKAIHYSGQRAERPFVAINCSALPEALLESELFGHAKGSFTGATQRKKGLFEEANSGTLFLDEIGDMNPSLQAKVLRVIQDRKIRPVGDNQSYDIDVRIIAATHKNLRQAIEKGVFREDLFYRLSVLPIVIPPLREHKEDIPILAQFFLDKYSLQNKTVTKGFSKKALEKILSMRWPGNIRELENAIERSVVLCSGEWIEDTDIPDPDTLNTDQIFVTNTNDFPSLYQFEERYIKAVLQKTGGRRNKAAQILGINRRTLCRKEKEFGWTELEFPTSL